MGKKTLEHRLFSLKKQLKLLQNIHRLARAKVLQQDIALQLVKFGNKIERKIGRDIVLSLEEGNSFANGIKPWLNSLAYEALAAGEHTGNWASGVQNAITTLNSKMASTTLLFKALWKPVGGTVAMLAAAAAASKYLFPTLVELKGNGRMGMLASLAQSFGDFWLANGSLLFLIFCFVSISVTVALPLLVGDIRKAIDNIPVFRQYRLIQVSAFLRSFGNLSLAGFGMKEALEHINRQTSPYLTSHIAKMMDKIEDGNENLGNIINTGLLNPAEQNSLFLLGEIGGFDETLLNSADIHHELLIDEIELIKSFGTNLLKILGVTIGVLVGGGVITLVMDIALNIRT